jgi:hypothetical protein
MNWINMSDRDKLYNYAKEYMPTDFLILKPKHNTDSYYIDCEDNNGFCDLAIMEYDIEQFIHLKKRLVDMWNNAGFKDPVFLATIVSATALKNMPDKTETEALRGKSVEKKAYESVNAQDMPPVFIYEF